MMNRKVKPMIKSLDHDDRLPPIKDAAADALVSDFVKQSYGLMLIAFEANVPEERREDIHLPVTYLTSIIQNIVIEMFIQGYKLSLDDVCSAATLAVRDLSDRVISHQAKAH